jgi:hypothetical protein
MRAVQSWTGSGKRRHLRVTDEAIQAVADKDDTRR